MFNPDGGSAPPKRVFKSSSVPAIAQVTAPPTIPTLQSREDVLHTYLDSSESFRRAHGFTRHEGKFYLVDKERVDTLGTADAELMEILRNWVRKKQSEKIWGGVQGGAFGDR